MLHHCRFRLDVGNNFISEEQSALAQLLGEWRCTILEVLQSCGDAVSGHSGVGWGSEGSSPDFMVL